jgi:DNA-binding NarL/FixJ family response regulator
MNAQPDSLLESAQRLAVLTDRQQQIATLVCDGFSNKIIARKLGVTEGTVKIHLHMIYKKLGVPSRTHLIIRFRTSQQAIV